MISIHRGVQILNMRPVKTSITHREKTWSEASGYLDLPSSGVQVLGVVGKVQTKQEKQKAQKKSRIDTRLEIWVTNARHI